MPLLARPHRSCPGGAGTVPDAVMGPWFLPAFGRRLGLAETEGHVIDSGTRDAHATAHEVIRRRAAGDLGVRL